MPIYNFLCTKCGTPFRKLYSVDQFKDLVHATPCACCGYYAQHQGGAPSSQTMEVIDDGIRAKTIERYAEAERLFQERADAHKQKYEKKDEEE